MENFKNKDNINEMNDYFQQPDSNGMNTSNIEQVVMRRVRRIHTVRRFMNKTAYKMYSAGALMALLFSTVSVGNVYANMPSLLQPTNLFQFVLRALLDTEITVQLTLLSLFAIVVLFVRDFLEKSSAQAGRNMFAQV